MSRGWADRDRGVKDTKPQAKPPDSSFLLPESARTRLEIDRQNDLLYIGLSPEGVKVAYSKRLGQVVLDFDKEDRLVGIELHSLVVSEAEARVWEEAAPLLASLKEFLSIRQAIIDVGGSEGPLDQEMITRLAEMQGGVVNRARTAIANFVKGKREER